MIDEDNILVLTNDDSKVCGHCRRKLPVTHFWRCADSPDTLQSWCIDCQKEYKSLRALSIKADREFIKSSTVPELMKSVRTGMEKRELRELLSFTRKLQTTIEKRLKQ